MLPRLWVGRSGWEKFIVLVNFLFVILAKCCQVANPLVLKLVIDAIICDPKTSKE